MKIDSGQFYLVSYNTGKSGCLEVRREHTGAGTVDRMPTPHMPLLGKVYTGLEKPVCLGEREEDKGEACRGEQSYIWKVTRRFNFMFPLR